MPRRTHAGMRNIRSDLPPSRQKRRRKAHATNHSFGIRREVNGPVCDDIYEFIGDHRSLIMDALRLSATPASDGGVKEFKIHERPLLGLTMIELRHVRDGIKDVNKFKKASAINQIVAGIATREATLHGNEVTGIRWIGADGNTLALEVNPDPIVFEERELALNVLEDMGVVSLRSRSFTPHVSLMHVKRGVTSEARTAIVDMLLPIATEIGDIALGQMRIREPVMGRSAESMAA